MEKHMIKYGLLVETFGGLLSMRSHRVGND